MRLFSSILFALMAMVLPMAGVQQHFCTMTMVFLDGGSPCPTESKDCCGEKKTHKPLEPDCMVSSKLIPNAEKSSPLQIPAAEACCIAPICPVDIFLATKIAIISPELDRGPPDLPKLYWLHGRLLI